MYKDTLHDNTSVLLHVIVIQEMMSFVKHMAATQDFKRDDMFVCVIMSHGSKGKVLGVDMATVEVETVKKTFCRLESLAGKPKIFLIAACQGSKF